MPASATQMPADAIAALTAHTWTPQPGPARFVQRLLNECLGQCSFAADLLRRMFLETGTRLVDWLDHFGLPADDPMLQDLGEVGYVRIGGLGNTTGWELRRGLFPRIRVHGAVARQLAIKVESVSDFLVAHGLTGIEIEGPPLATVRTATVARVPRYGPGRGGAAPRGGDR